MNPRDIIVSVLTPGTPCNTKGKIYRSIGTLAAFTQLSNGEVLELLLGDLSQQVVMRPGKKGLMAALKVYVPEQPQAQLPVQFVGGPAFNPPAQPAPMAIPVGLVPNAAQAEADVLEKLLDAADTNDAVQEDDEIFDEDDE